MNRWIPLLLLLLAGPAWADTLISSLPYTASTTGERYFLTSDLSTAATGITVTGDNVTIDLQGHTISQTSTGLSLLILSGDGCTIEDGRLVAELGSDRAINNQSGANLTINRVFVYCTSSYALYCNQGGLSAESSFFYSGGLQSVYFADGCSSASLINCTIVSEAINAVYTRMDASDTMAMHNCILALAGSTDYAFRARNATWSGLTATYNWFYRPSGTGLLFYEGAAVTDAETFDPNSRDGDPQFVNWVQDPGGSWEVAEGSGAINDGSNAFVTSSTDVDGHPRIVETTVDMGAYEYQGNVQGLPGACCATDGTCTEVPLSACGGDFQGEGTVCIPNPCPQPSTGACCFADGTCQVLASASCGGVYQGDGTVCSPNPCPPPAGGDHVDLSNLPDHPRLFLSDAILDTIRTEVDDPSDPKYRLYQLFLQRLDANINQSTTQANRAFAYALAGLISGNSAYTTWAHTLFMSTYTNWPNGDGNHYRALTYDMLYDDLSPTERTQVELFARTAVSGQASRRRRYSNLAANETGYQGIMGLVFYGQGGDDTYWQSLVDQWMWEFEGSHDWDIDTGTAPERGGLIEINDTYYKQGMHHKGIQYAINKQAIDFAFFYCASKYLGLADYVTDAEYMSHFGEQLCYMMRPDGYGSRLMNGQQFWLDERGHAATALTTWFWGDKLSSFILEHDFPSDMGTYGGIYGEGGYVIAYWRSNRGSTAPVDSLAISRFFGQQGEDNSLSGDNWAERAIIRTGWSYNAGSDDLYFGLIGGDYFDGFNFYQGGIELYGYGGVLLNQGGAYAVPGEEHGNNVYERVPSRNMSAILDPTQTTPGDIWGQDHLYYTDPQGPESLYDVDNDSRYDTADITRWDAVQDQEGANVYYSRVQVNPAAAYRLSSRDIDSQEREVAVSWPYLVVRDHIDTGDPSYYIKVLWHSIYTPAMSTSITNTVVSGHVEDFARGRVYWKGLSPRGKVVIDPLLPADATVRRVGGTGFDCWVYDPVTEEGTNYPLPNPGTPNAPMDSTDYETEWEVGRWRIETTATPGDTLADFVHVLQVLPTAGSPVTTAAIDSANAIGAEFDGHAYVFGLTAADSLERNFRTTDADTMMVYLFRMAADSLFSVAVAGSPDTLHVLSDGGPVMVRVPSGITHVFVGAGTPPATGACCYPDGSCVITSEAGCTGAYEGDDTTCSPNPCPPPVGACCADDGGCTITTAAACPGTWQGSGTVCSPNPCPFPTGRCCLDDASCIDDITEAACSDSGGYNWQEGFTCAERPCTGRGACCVGETCSVLDPTTCGLIFGQWLGAGTTCVGDPCATTTGACCVSTTCYQITEAACTDSSGTYQGDDTDCIPDPCSGDPTGACCDADSSCVVLTEALCNTSVLTYLGDGTDCDPNPCPAPQILGACCIGEECLLLTVGDCQDAGGDYQGDESSCFSGRCPIEAAMGRVHVYASKSTMLQLYDPVADCTDTTMTVAYESDRYLDGESVGVLEFTAPNLPANAQIAAVELRATVIDTTGINRVSVYGSQVDITICVAPCSASGNCRAGWLTPYQAPLSWDEAGAHGTADRGSVLVTHEGFAAGARITIGDGYPLVAWVRDVLLVDGTGWLIFDGDHNSTAEVTFKSATSTDPPELVIWYIDQSRRRTAVLHQMEK